MQNGNTQIPSHLSLFKDQTIARPNKGPKPNCLHDHHDRHEQADHGLAKYVLLVSAAFPALVLHMRRIRIIFLLS